MSTLDYYDDVIARNEAGIKILQEIVQELKELDDILENA